MRLLTFSVLKNSKLKFWSLPRRFSAPAEQEKPAATGDPSLVEISGSWPAEEDPEMRAAVLRDMRVLPDFVSEAEEAALLEELEPYLKRMRYEFDHWDNAIQGYRETERSAWRPANEAVLRRVRRAAFAAGQRALPHVHVLDLAPAGHIKPHVDAVRFCGAVIAGLSLCSAAVMRLQHADHPHRIVDALLARRSLYIMKGVARYSFTHAVLGGTGAGAGAGEHAASEWRGRRVPRQRRVALICRDAPDKHA